MRNISDAANAAASPKYIVWIDFAQDKAATQYIGGFVKWVLAAVLSFCTGAAALAAVPSAETLQVSRVFLNNPEIIERVRANGSMRLADLQIKEQVRGVYQYTILFMPDCMCPYKNMTVKVSEDMRLTWADGAIKYSDLTIEYK